MVKVVIADDEQFVRLFLKMVMKSLDYEVIGEAENGEELVAIMTKTRPDILLLDICMPNLTGIEFLQKHGVEYPNTCIILLTSVSLMKLIGEKSISHVKCFLSKNTPLEEMMAAIQNTWEEFEKKRHVKTIRIANKKILRKKIKAI